MMYVSSMVPLYNQYQLRQTHLNNNAYIFVSSSRKEQPGENTTQGKSRGPRSSRQSNASNDSTTRTTMAGKCDGTVSATYANCTSAIDSYLCQAKAYSDAVMATISSMCVFSGSFSISNALLYAALSKMFANLHEKCGKTRKSTALHRTFLSWL